MMATPEAGERIARLETSMAYVLEILSRREAYQNSVLESLTEIKLNQTRFLEYQKECEAKREAHDTRIKRLEDAWKVLRGQAVIIAALVGGAVTVLDLCLRK